MLPNNRGDSRAGDLQKLFRRLFATMQREIAAIS
jgi:hypothetical protein